MVNLTSKESCEELLMILGKKSHEVLNYNRKQEVDSRFWVFEEIRMSDILYYIHETVEFDSDNTWEDFIYQFWIYWWDAGGMDCRGSLQDIIKKSGYEKVEYGSWTDGVSSEWEDKTTTQLKSPQARELVGFIKNNLPSEK